MAIYFTLFAFVDCAENGGSEKKLALIWTQAKNVASKMKRKDVTYTGGRTTYSGEVMHRKGYVYHVDYAVTGSNYCTPDDPACPLLSTFIENIFPMI